MKDKFNTRVLCQRCLSEMRLCGYKLQRTDAKEKEDFSYEIIDRGDTLEELNEKERYWIAEYNCLWPNEVKANTLQVKFILDYNASRDFTLMQFYTNTRGLEGMIYVTRFLIKRIEKNS